MAQMAGYWSLAPPQPPINWNYVSPQSATLPVQTAVPATAPAASPAFRATAPTAQPVPTALPATVPAAVSGAGVPASVPSIVPTVVLSTTSTTSSRGYQGGDERIKQKIGELQENISSFHMWIDEEFRQRNSEKDQKIEKLQEILKKYQERERMHYQRVQEIAGELSYYQGREKENNKRIQDLEGELSDYQGREKEYNKRIQDLEGELSGLRGPFEYRMNRCPRGMCVIINNVNFKNSNGVADKREGAEFDLVELEKLFNELSFSVCTYHDLNWLEMLRVATYFAGQIDHNQFDAFVFIVMSHGGERDVIYGVNGRSVRVEDLMFEFKVKNCPTLQNKPKLFFIQSCRGTLNESPCPAVGDVDSPPVFLSDSTLPRSTCPREADFLLSFATAPGYFAYRKPQSGSPFVQTLVKTIREYHESQHLLDILTEVNRRVVESGIYEGAGIQVPAPTHSLRGKVYLK